MIHRFANAGCHYTIGGNSVIAPQNVHTHVIVYRWNTAREYMSNIQNPLAAAFVCWAFCALG